jgi:hypothetical protein
MNKLTVGQKVWFETASTANKYETYEVTITKVGRQYFSVNRITLRFFVDSLICEDYTIGRIYLTHQELLDKQESVELKSAIRQYFDNWNTMLPLQQLRSIMDMINQERQKQGGDDE